MTRYMDPGDFNQQFLPGMRIWVMLPGGTFSGTLIRTFGSSAEIQLDSGNLVTVTIDQISIAGFGAPPVQPTPPWQGGGGWPISGSGGTGSEWPGSGGWSGGGTSGAGWNNIPWLRDILR